MLSDATLNCCDCQQPFVFTIGEQQFYASKNIINPPTRCPSCRAREKRRIDLTLHCGDCGQEFTFTKGEQRFYQQHSMTTPTRCPNCRERNKVQPRSNAGSSGQQRQLYSAYCADCGTQTQVPFQPRPGRAIYC